MTKTEIDVMAREMLVSLVLEAAEAKGWAVERVEDYGTVAVEVPIGETGARWMKMKATAPKLQDKDGNEMWNLDEAIEGYLDRKRKDAEKAKTKAEKAAESERKKAERKAAAEKKEREKAAQKHEEGEVSKSDLDENEPF